MPILLTAPEVQLWSGDPNFALPGSGKAVPAGLEAVYEYNGMYLNDRTVIDKYRLLEIGGLEDADVRDAREVNPSDHGETPFDSYYGGRTITLQGRIEAHNIAKLRDMEMSLKQSFGTLKEKPLYIHAPGGVQNKVFINCRKTQALQKREIQSNYSARRDFLLTLRASDPRFQSVLRPQASGSIPAGTNVVVTVNNNGNFDARPIYRITGGINSTTLTNEATGQKLILSGTISSGAWIEINIQDRTIKDNTGANRFNLLNVASGWPTLISGSNPISISSASISGSPQLSVTWRHTWI